MHVEETEDPGLALFRNPVTKETTVRFFENLTGNKKIADIILIYADQNDVPLNLAFSLAWAESGFYPSAVNKNYSSVDRGLFQLNNLSFPHLKEEDFFNPGVNAKYGLAYLKNCLSMGGNYIVALAMYNAGSYRVEANGTPRGTLDYIAKILDYMERVDTDLGIYLGEHNIRLVTT